MLSGIKYEKHKKKKKKKKKHKKSEEEHNNINKSNIQSPPPGYNDNDNINKSNIQSPPPGYNDNYNINKSNIQSPPPGYNDNDNIKKSSIQAPPGFMESNSNSDNNNNNNNSSINRWKKKASKTIDEQTHHILNNKNQGIKILSKIKNNKNENDAVDKEEENISELTAKALRYKLKGQMTKYNEINDRIKRVREKSDNVELYNIKLKKQKLLDQSSDNIIDKDGRKGYFKADINNNYDLKDLVMDEKLNHRQNYDNNYAHSIMKNSKFSLAELDLDTQFETADISMEQYEDNERKGTAKQQKAKMMQRTIADYKRYEQRIQKCWYCYNSKNMIKELIVAIGESIYVSIPSRGHLIDGHCILVPREHIISCIEMDNNIFNEIQSFKRHLVNIYQKQNKGVIFFEQVDHLHQQRHTNIHCIPLQQKYFDQAQIYFKKGIMESDTEWSQHKKLIDTNNQKTIQKCIPPNFAYFHVEFGMNIGYAHAIEDENSFSNNFGHHIICGILGEPAEIMIRSKRASKHIETQRVKTMRKLWKTSFD